MELKTFKCGCCDEVSFDLNITPDECTRWERQGCTVELTKTELEELLYSIQKALLKPEEFAYQEVEIIDG